MNRKQVLNKAFQRGHLLSTKNNLYKNWIDKFIVDEIKGDVGDKGDITSDSVLKNGKKVKALVYSRSDGIVAGIEEVCWLLRKNKVKVKELKKDGRRIVKGSELLMLEGNEKNILRLERSVLDILSRMSGIATLTNDLTMHKVGIAPTRKTQWRYLDKKAVYVGGGLTHRLALWESILIKDNHLSALKKEQKNQTVFPTSKSNDFEEKVSDVIEVALERAWKKRKKGIFVEIEVTNGSDAIKAAQKFKELQSKNNNTPCLIMLDNLSGRSMKNIIRKLKIKKLYNHVLIEASGGITPKKIKEYSKSGVDVISLGYLTTSSQSLNIKLRVM
ncbi:MAG: hypothetical protein U9O94_09845 [Nanoarchaeota archaeon]|nr:hypothetical protein [Nanoarchaeota archaeon]